MKIHSVKNKRWSFVAILLLFHLSNISAKKLCYEKVTICYVDFNIMTTVDVSCSEFDNAFKGETFNHTITDTIKIKKLIALLNKLQIDKESQSVDARLKIKLYHKNVLKVICMDKFQVFMGGHIFKMNKNLLLFIEELKK